jgi:hypothetical protein
MTGKVVAKAKLRQPEFRQEAQLRGTRWYTDKMRISSAFLVSRHRVSLTLVPQNVLGRVEDGGSVNLSPRLQSASYSAQTFSFRHFYSSEEKKFRDA